MDKETLDELNDKIDEYLKNKHWADLTQDEVDMIDDLERKKEYREGKNKCIYLIITPLYSSIKKSSNFKFSNPDNLLTCRNMIKDLMDYYYNLGYTTEEIIQIAKDNDSSKKY